MAIGDMLAYNTPGPQARVGAAMNPQAVASQAQPNGQGGIGALLAGLQQNPAAIQALLNTGSRLLNPQDHGSAGGRIASAAAQGVGDYTQMSTAAAERQRQADLEDKQMELRERQVDQGDRKLDLSEESFEMESKQWQQSFGLKEEQLEAQKELWKSQMDRYAADAERLRAVSQGGVDPTKLTGPERIINNIAGTLTQAGAPEERSYLMAFDIYNKSQESEAKALASAAENLGFLSGTEEGKALLEQTMSTIKDSFRGAAEEADRISQEYQQGQGAQTQAPAADPNAGTQEIAPGVTQGDVEMALQAISESQGAPVTLDSLNAAQRERLFDLIRQRKQGAQ